ncbi:MAG: TrkH family potassium uptake protein [Acidimicrobiales bacterium]
MLLQPARVVVLAFVALIATGTTLLSLPAAHAPGRSTSLLEAVFTATSAVCVTGLVVVDTATHWSVFGQVVILALIQIGGFGVMTLGSLVALFLSRRIGIRLRMRARTEAGAVSLGDVKRLVKVIAVVTVAVEAVAAIALTLEFARTSDLGWRDSAWHGLFHSISAFNNAGFSLNSDSLVGFVHNWWVIGTIAATVVVGGLGFPVVIDIWDRRLRPRVWSLHTKITVATSAFLLVTGMFGVLLFEWSNEATIGEFALHEKLLAATFHSVNTRTAGFNSVDTGAMNETTLFASDGLMLIGGGSASTAGGIKVTTFVLLAFVIWAEVRGRRDVEAFDRRIETGLQRQALSVALIAVGVVVLGTLGVVAFSGVELSAGLFEVTSAFGTVGLSTGITPTLDAASQVVLIALMLIGRVGPLTFGAALVLASHPRRYRRPSEGLMIG